MTEELILLALLMLIGTHGLLVKGCMKLHEIIPNHGDSVASEASQIKDILDELADLLNAGIESIPTQAITSNAQSLPEILLTGLMSNFAGGSAHGPQENERTIHEINPTPTLETED